MYPLNKTKIKQVNPSRIMGNDSMHSVIDTSIKKYSHYWAFPLARL